MKTLSDLKTDLAESVADFDREKRRLFGPDAECECGHTRFNHMKLTGPCGAEDEERSGSMYRDEPEWRRCGCRKFETIGPERLYHQKCGSLVMKRWWWQKPEDPDMPICVVCNERVAENDLLTYEEWKNRIWDSKPARS